MQVRIPKRFIEDHESRACLQHDDGSDCRISDVLIKETAKHYVVELTEMQALELHSDAEHYAISGVQEYGIEFAGLIASARATRDAVKQALTK